MSSGQSDATLIPLSNKLLLNPAYAGLSRSSNMMSGVQFLINPLQQANHLFSLTYDNFSEKLKGGIAWLFFQGLDGENSSGYTGTGLTFAKSLYTSKNGQLITAANLNYLIFTKQLYGYAAERLVTENDNYHLNNTTPFLKYNELSPRAGLLWSSYGIRTGISLSVPFRFYNGQKTKNEDHPDYISVISFTKKLEGITRGLLSKPYSAEPEAVVILSDRHLITRAGIKLENTNNNAGLFILNDFSDELHGLAGIFGWNIKNIKISFTAGSLYSIPFQTISFYGEAFIGVSLRKIQFDKEKPWAPL
jgi:hypothetical protein